MGVFNVGEGGEFDAPSPGPGENRVSDYEYATFLCSTGPTALNLGELVGGTRRVPGAHQQLDGRAGTG